MRSGIAAALLLAACAGAAAAQEEPPVPEGKPVASAPLRDAEFGVRTREFGLQRRVEMYQWRRRGTAYRKAWESEPVDSSAYDAAHANPASFPLRTRYWIATRVVLDGRPVDEDVLKVFGRWRSFRPGFNELPGNLSATFQPEGDGLSSAENPLDPQIGDLRITWHELTLPALAGRVALEDGAWVPVAAVDADDPAVAGTRVSDIATAAKRISRHAWLLGGAGVLAFVALGLALRWRSRRRRP